jgi:hypothetical protein
MKVIGSIAVFIIFISYSFAESSMTTSCSSSDGAIRWQLGSADERVDLQYSNFIEGTLELEVEDVSIDLINEITFSEEEFKEEDIFALKKVTVARALITASEKHPDVLKGQFPQNKVEGEVICTRIILNQK